MEIKDATDKLDQADGFLTKLKTILKKHWGILLLILLGLGIYWIFTTDFEEDDNLKPATVEDIFIIEKLYDLDENGDTILIDIYSDGTRDEYYK